MLKQWVILSILFFTSIFRVHSEEDVIRIGAPLSLSGKYKDISKYVKDGYDIALKRLNDQGGVRVNNKAYRFELVYVDDHSSKEGAGFATIELIENKKINFLLGPYGSELSLVVSKIAEERKIPLIQSQGAALDLYVSDKNKLQYTFSPASSADQYFESMLQILADVSVARGKAQKDLKIALFYLEDQGTLSVRQGILQKMQELGIEPIEDKMISKGFDNLGSLLKEVAQKKPDGLIATLLPNGAKALAKALKQENIYIPMVGLSHCDAAGLEKMSPDSDYLLCVAQWDMNMGYKDIYFKDSVNYSIEYENQFGYTPPYQSAGASTSLVLFSEAIKKAQSLDVEKVREALQNIKIETLFGEIRFDEDKKRGKPMVLYQILKNKYHIVLPVDKASLRLIFPMPSWEERLKMK
jgi:branched-chain amino acid transport system substrate-binding protein